MKTTTIKLFQNFAGLWVEKWTPGPQSNYRYICNMLHYLVAIVLKVLSWFNCKLFNGVFVTEVSNVVIHFKLILLVGNLNYAIRHLSGGCDEIQHNLSQWRDLHEFPAKVLPYNKGHGVLEINKKIRWLLNPLQPWNFQTRYSKRPHSFYFRLSHVVVFEMRSIGPVSLRRLTDLSLRGSNNILALTYLNTQRQQCDSYVLLYSALPIHFL